MVCHRRRYANELCALILPDLHCACVRVLTALRARAQHGLFDELFREHTQYFNTDATGVTVRLTSGGGGACVPTREVYDDLYDDVYEYVYTDIYDDVYDDVYDVVYTVVNEDIYDDFYDDVYDGVYFDVTNTFTTPFSISVRIFTVSIYSRSAPLP
ncbi:unnamed protein product, partial [Iphiclides podalirius]